MIINITYPNKKTSNMITEIVGNSYSLLDRWKMKGIGSGKLIIDESSPEISKIIRTNRDTAYCNMELRLLGVVVGFNSTGRIYAWCIPYHLLNIYYNGGNLSIHGPDNFIKAKHPFNGKVNMGFLKKVLKIKSDNNPRL